jgi:prepilin-type N-terminal cleavage/methylation domain-containing protein
VDRGFSLIEVLVASVVMTIALVALAQLSVVSIHTNQVARRTTFATVLASQKMEQLQALAWTFDGAGAPLSDTTTDTTVVPERSVGGTGLAPSPTDAIARETPGYCDFLDSYGRSVAPDGAAVPMATAYVRRWSIEALSAADALLIQVSVTPRGAGPSIVVRRPEEARLIAIKARKSG